MQAAWAAPSACEIATLRQGLAWQRAGKAVAVATVIVAWGSAPRPVGAKLVVADDGTFAGSVSGGCVENAVITEALACIEDGAPRVLDYEGDASLPWAVGLPCGGSIRVYVQRLGPAVATALEQVAQGHIALVQTNLATGAQTNGTERMAMSDEHVSSTAQNVSSTPHVKHPGLVAAAGEDVFMDVLHPPLRMIIAGATHLAQSLSAMALIYGYDVSIADPRAAYLLPARFEGARLVPGAPGDAVAALGPTAQTAVIVVSHDPKIDDPALVAALRSDAFYIGALGSRKSHAARLNRLREAGFGDAALARIHGPVGLHIGAVTPPEIAGSILAEITQLLRRGA